MRILVIVTFVFALLYGGYWFVGRSAVVAATDGFVADLDAAGIDVSWDRIGTRGFPSRFDTTAEGLVVEGAAFRWDAPFLQVAALSYRPNRIIAVLPPTQSLSVGGVELTLSSERLRASAEVAPAPALPLRTATIEGDALAVAAGPGTAAARYGLAAIRETPLRGQYDLYLQLADTTIFDRVTFGAVRADLLGHFDRRLDRTATADPPAIERLEIREARFVSEALVLTITGELDFAPTGQPDGDLEVVVSDWPAAIRLLQEVGLISPARARQADGLANAGGEVTLPLSFRDGEAFLFGLIPLR